MAVCANSMYYGRNTTDKEKEIYVADDKRQTAKDVLDPILIVIKNYYAAMEEFEALPDEDDDAPEYTWVPWWELIAKWDRPILTAEGDIAAINLVYEETQDTCGSKIVEPLLNAVKEYLINKH